ncbi:MAG: helix-turn-helix domain-containing protein, partial [Oceanidesulfovibrio sp.]
METDAFGKRVRYLRTLAKLTQARMAEQLGITPEHLGNIERGVSAPSFELIYRMANVLNTEPFNLFLFPRDRSEPCRSPVDISWSCFYSGMGNWEYDMLTGSMHWSKSLYRLLGFSPKDVEPSIELMLERIHPNDLERIREKWLQLLAGDNVAPIIFRVRIDKGEYRSVINFGEARKEQNRIVGFNIDITENCMLLDAFRELQDLVEEETAGRTRSLNDMIVLLASAMDTKDSVQAELEDR